MERTISQEERIRRAEEIYNRRRYENRNSIYSSNYRVNTRENKDISSNIKQKMAHKMIAQMLICVVIYAAIYIIQHSNQLFSQDILTETKKILAYDISFETLYGKTSEYFNNIQKYLNGLFVNQSENDSENNQNINEEQNIESNNSDKENETQQLNTDNEENVINNIEEQATIESEEEIAQIEEKTQEEQDIDYVKNNINIIWPIKGTITSRFGSRTPTDIVSANHYGLDIGGNMGDPINSAIDGIVTLASEESGYGKYIKVENGEISTLYAHCSELLVQEGIEVQQGQKIAKVGATGKATGPHLHFEIRRENRIINPEEILGII